MPSKYILVVDDEVEVTMTLKGLFAALGYQMLTALDGNEALKIIEAEDPALILLDIRMPGVDGIQILNKVKKEKPATKVIVMTTFVKENRDAVEKIGIDGFFQKPIDLNGLMERIKLVLDESQQSTRYFPSKEKEPAELEGIPKAKILFIEPSPIVYGFTCSVFNIKEMVKGEFQIKVVYGGAEGYGALYTWNPDIVVMYDSLFEMDGTNKFADILMSSHSHKPKVVILHGLVPKMDLEIKQLEKLGIKFCNQHPMDDETLRASNKKLVEFVERECLKHGLKK